MRKLNKVYLEITNVCNLRCKFCPGTVRSPRFMTAEEFGALSSRLKGHTDYLYFHLMGEPTLHPRLKELLEIAGESGFRVIITTNGTLLAERGETLISSPAVHKVNISLQSFEANEGEKLEHYVNQCAEFAVKASEAGKICVLRLWNKNGYDTLNGRILDILKLHFPGKWEDGRRGTGIGERVWLEDGEKFDWPDMGAEDRGERCFCYGLRDQIGVLCDGTVVPCCLDHNGDLALGNLFESSLEDIMSTERAKNIYEGFSRRRASEELCRKCGYSRRFG